MLKLVLYLLLLGFKMLSGCREQDMLQKYIRGYVSDLVVAIYD